MIIYDLQCLNGHAFEGWFEDSKDYEKQIQAKMIQCPVCNITDVVKIPSTFAIKQSQPAKKMSDAQLQLENLHKKVVQFIEKHFEDVGPNFAREALKMHYGVKEPRNIRGVSTEAEEKILTQEGIEFFKIPMPRTSETES